MRTIKRAADFGCEIPIGRRGENCAVCVVFDVSKWVAIYGDGNAELLHRRPGDAAPYPCALTRDGDTVTWTITSADTDVVGYGEAELRWYAGETLAKSVIYRTVVRKALDDGAIVDPPDPADDWLKQLRDEIATKGMPPGGTAGQVLTKISADDYAAEWSDGGGGPGVSPSARVEKIGSVATITITDKDGTTTASISDGAPGAPGAKGDKGDSYILTAADKAEIAGMVETTVDDVQINGTSIVEDNIAKIPVAGEKLGAVKIGATQGRYGLRTNNEGNIFVEKAASSTVKNGAESYQPIVPATQHEAAFYGLAKVAGYDERGSELTVGQYTDEAKAAIKSMLGVQDNIVVNVTGTGEIRSVDHTFAEISSALSRGINVVVDDTDAVQPYVGRVDINGAVYLAFGVSATYNGVSALTGYLITGMGDGTVALRVEQNTNIVSDVKVNGASVVDGGVASISVTDGKDGKDGADGHTPVKGVDYWTAADKAELVADVLAEFVDLTEVAQ